jgi:hypothetical protein
MPHANRPAGPGRPIQERRDASTEREELEEMSDEAQGQADAPPRDPSRSARQAERVAHVRENPDSDRAPGRQRP